MKATAKDLRVRGRELLDAVDRGERVTITFRGRPRAILVPLDAPRRRDLESDPAFGLWRDHTGVVDVEAYVDRVRRSRT
ncbi:MAG: type II toxin-antitoxin system prevent-host-death family antitoxin [Deltaproteobacteria bacterium]|nr:type II toxin-antitoxin system prevent-host-death family antitoxin [Deltaproteobacteria bacterium]